MGQFCFGLAIIAIAAALGWYGTQVASEGWKKWRTPDEISAQQKISFPLVDLELKRPESGYTYDIFLHNKSDETLSNIQIARVSTPNKNKQKKALHSSVQGELKPFQVTVNVLGANESKKIYREHSPSYDYAIISVTYKNSSGKLYKCEFEGDRDGMYLQNNYEIGKNPKSK
ncbi:MAG: hypothetical protein ACOY8P_13040 [Thermodesulfobacteriota bacterium]